MGDEGVQKREDEGSEKEGAGGLRGGGGTQRGKRENSNSKT